MRDFLKLEGAAEIPEMMRDLGLGPSMYLLFLKGLRNLFFILTLINIPIILIYSSGDVAKSYDWGAAKIFGSLNIGNLGEDNIILQSYAVFKKNSFKNGLFKEEIK